MTAVESARPRRVLGMLFVISGAFLVAGLVLIRPAGLLPESFLPVPILFLFLSHLLILVGILAPASQWLGPVVTRFRTDNREVWLTIDDGPDPGETPELLDLLDANGATATFFLIGEKAARHPDLVRAILRRGHSIGNHTQAHRAFGFWKLGRNRVRTEIADCNEQLRKITGKTPRLFRAPAGHKPWPLHPVLREFDLPLIAWSARGFDGSDTSVDRIVARLRRRFEPGAILLLHEGRGTAPFTLERLLGSLSASGYRCVLPPSESFLASRRKVSR